MVGLCLGSLALLVGMLGFFGLSWYKGRQNGRKQKQTNEHSEEIREVTA
jgi:hypothetical protein